MPTLETKTTSKTRAKTKAKKQERRRQARRKAAVQLPDDESVAEDNDTSPNPEDVPGMSQGTQSRKEPKSNTDCSSPPRPVILQEHEVEKIFDVHVAESKDSQLQVQ